MTTLQLEQVALLAGQTLVLHDIPWQQFEEILEALGEHRGSRIAYNKGILKIMTPLPEHEVIKGIVSDLIKITLEELGLDFESLGYTTFKRQDMEKGVEPDDSRFAYFSQS